jgi:SAM-dependent methyltransferase
MARAPRRFDLSEQELEQIAAARAGRLGMRGALRLLARDPRLLGEVARVAGEALRSGLFASNSLSSLLGAERARLVVADAATGVGWYDERPFLAALSPFCSPSARALELGCGAGRISRHVAPLVGELVCTDVSGAMVDEARANLRPYANATVRRTDGYALGEFSAGSFDLCFGQGVLGYLAPNQLLGLLGEIARVLAPGGVSVFNFFTIDDPRDGAAHLATVLEQARKRRPHGGIDQAYTRAQLQAMHELAGLAVARPDRGGGEGESEGEAVARGRIVVVARRRAGGL